MLDSGNIFHFVIAYIGVKWKQMVKIIAIVNGVLYNLE
jgi:hypothetical protein